MPDYLSPTPVTPPADFCMLARISQPMARVPITTGGSVSSLACCGLLLLCSALAAFAAPKATNPPHTLELQVDSPEADVLQAVRDVINDQIIHGTYSYEKEKTLMGARSAEGSSVF